MRPVFVVAMLGTTLAMNPARAQSSGEQPVAGAAGSKKAESHPQHDGYLTENGPRRKRVEPQPEEETVPAPVPAPPTPQVHPPAPVIPTVQAVPPGPPQKELTGKEFALIRVGSTAKEVLEVLGPPSSRVVVPDDDGHLRETFQYWVKGSPMGTVRLDNGRVIQIETQPK